MFKWGKGCQKCNYIGYCGWMGVFELFELIDLMMNVLKVGDIVVFGEYVLCSLGYKLLFYVVLIYVKMGQIMVEEVLKLVEMVVEFL